MAKKINKKVVKIILFVLILIVAGWVGSAIGEQIFKARYFKSLNDFEFIEVQENPVCPIHEYAPSNAPILVNLNEGSIGYLKLYNIYPTYPLQIKEEDEYGVMWVLGGKGWSGAAFPDSNYVHFSIQRNRMFNYSSNAAKLFFCDDCMKAFRELEPSCNFIIVDAYEKNNIKYYDIADIEETNIRHYSFTIIDKGYDLLSIDMASSFYDGGNTLDFLNKEDTTELEKGLRP